MAKGNVCETILNAAEDVVMEMGAAHMSLEVVAKKAEVSKGGLLYHFPSKKSLLNAMLERLVERFKLKRERYCARLKPGAGAQLKADVLTTLDVDKRQARMCLSMLAAIACDPELLSVIGKVHKENLKYLAKTGLPFERASIVFLAADGLMFQKLFQITPYSNAQIEKLKKELLRMVDELECRKGAK